MAYKLLDQFRALFDGKQYNHRDSTQGDSVAGFLFEDLFALGKSPKFRAAAETQSHVSNRQNRRVGKKHRRGDGTFGEAVPGAELVRPDGLAVAVGEVATIEIGAEVKIMAKAMLKQLDRVGTDLENQAAEFRKYGGNPICVGIVAVNYANSYTSYEGTRSYPTTGTGGMMHPAQEADQAESRLVRRVASKFDEFLILRFSASNIPPFTDFRWKDIKATESEYGAVLVRISREYEKRF